MINSDWSKMAASILKKELVKSNVDYVILTERLNAIGVTDTYKAVSSKINRGTFSFVFFLQCMIALNKKEIHL